MRVVVAVLMTAVIGGIGVGMLRSLTARTPANVPLAEPQAPPANTRVTYWCSTCGTEVLLLRKGSEAPPRHCAEPMQRREEIARN
jgi:hypothetical protein